MDVFECVSTLSSIRSYLKRDVPLEIVKKIVQAGRLAPSAHNDQPWKFIIIKDRDRLKELGKYCLSGRFVEEASFSVVVVADKSSKWGEIDGTRAVQNMVITAWSFKVGSCWIGRLDREGLSEMLSIPSGWHILTVLPFGYFKEELVGKRKIRKPEREVFSLESFDGKTDLFSE